MAKTRKKDNGARLPKTETTAPAAASETEIKTDADTNGHGAPPDALDVPGAPMAGAPVLAPVAEAEPLVLSPEPVAETPLPAPEPVQELTLRYLLNSLTIETVCYTLLFLTAIAMRFLNLGGRPLAGHEAASALAAWQFLQGQGTALAGSPLLFSANLFTFFLGAPTDTTPRLFPALVGSLAVLLPLLIRRELGRTGALLASLLLLLSTSLVYFARDVSGAEISTVAGTAAFIWFWRYRSGGQSRDLNLAAIAAALALTASSAGYTLLLAGLATLFLSRTSEGRKAASLLGVDASDRTDGDADAPTGGRAEWRAALILFIAVYIGLSTSLLIHREGLGQAFNLLGAWLAQFSQIGPMTSPLNLLLLYEPLLLVYGLAGLLLVPTLNKSLGPARGILLFLSTLIIVALVVYSVVGVKSTQDLVVLAAPLALLAGWFLGNLFERGWDELRREGGWRVALWGELPIMAVAFVFAIFFYLLFAMFLTQNTFPSSVESLRLLFSSDSTSNAFDLAALLIAVLAVVISVIIVILARFMIGGARTANLAAFIVAILLLVSGVRALWLANYASPDAVPELIATDQTAVNVRDLVSDLEWQSEWRANDQHLITMQADPQLGPTVRWYLRAFPNVQWTGTGASSTNVQAVLTGAEGQSPPGNWIDQQYDVTMEWHLQDTTRQQIFKWLVFRDGAVEDYQSVRLWVQQPQ